VETISIKDSDGKVYKFEKPEFEVELYSVKPQDGTKVIIGAFYSPDRKWHTGKWGINGNVGIRYNSSVNLTPIKPKWYEDGNNFPALITDGKIFEIAESFNITKQRFNFRNIYYSNICNGWRLATKEEIESLYYQDKEAL